MNRNRFPNPDSEELPWERADRIAREQDAEEERLEYIYQRDRGLIDIQVGREEQESENKK